MLAAKPLIAFSAFWLVSCAAIKSVVGPTDMDGLTYYMPRKDILITVSYGNSKEGDSKKKETAKANSKAGSTEAGSTERVPKVTIDVTKAYPDRANRYLLRHGDNAFGKNTLDIVITEKGLLSSAKSTTISSVSEALKGLATAAGNLSVLAIEGSRDEKECGDGDFTFLYPAPETATKHDPCGLSLLITPVTGTLAEAVVSAVAKSQESTPPDTGTTTTAATTQAKDKNEPARKGSVKRPGVEYAGVFYRQELPYLVTVSSGNVLHQMVIVYSPSRSEDWFLPASRTFFSNNKAEFGFSEGVPKSYLQETEGEGTALFKLPAEVIAAYFAAIGAMFDAFKANDTKQAAALAEALKLEIMKRKYEGCLAALASNDATKLKDLGCMQ